MTPSTSHPAAQFSSEVAKAHGQNWTNWLGHLKDQPNVVGLELGTWLGESAEWFCDNIFTHPTSRFITVDTHEGSDEHRLAGIDCTRNEEIARGRLARFGDVPRIIKARSDEFLRHQAARPSYDFVYIDAAHDAMNVLRDSVLAFDYLKPGGILIWDDYEWTVMRDEIDRPKIAIDSFLSCYARRLEIVGMGWQVCAKKIA